MVWCVRRRDLSRDLKEVREGVKWTQGRGKSRCQVPVECSGTVCPLQSRLLSLLFLSHTEHPDHHGSVIICFYVHPGELPLGTKQVPKQQCVGGGVWGKARGE